MELKQILAILRDYKAQLAEKYGISEIGVFGSVSRDEIREDSDIDVFVKMHPDLLKRACLKEELESIFGKKVDVVRYRPGMNKFLKKRIDNEGTYV